MSFVRMFCGLLVLLLGRVLEERRGRDDDEDAVDRAVPAVLLQQLQEGRPLRGVGGRLLLEREPPGGVEDDRLVREPPVAVARAARAREGVAADRELEPRVLERRALARLRLADEEVPGERVDLRGPAPFRLGERLGPLHARGPSAPRGPPASRRRRRSASPSRRSLSKAPPARLVAPLDERLEEDDASDDDEQPDEEEPPVLLRARAPEREEADGMRRKTMREVLDRLGQPLEEGEEFVHRPTSQDPMAWTPSGSRSSTERPHEPRDARSRGRGRRRRRWRRGRG